MSLFTYEIAGIVTDKNGRKRFLSFGAKDTEDEAKIEMEKLRIQKPDILFNVKRLQGWD